MLVYESIPWDRWTTTAWPLVVQLAFDATLILASAGLACWVLRRASASLRHGIWTVAIVGLLALPVLRMALPGVPLGRLLPIPADLPESSLARADLLDAPRIADAAIDPAAPSDAAYRGLDAEPSQTAPITAHPAGQDASFAHLLDERPWPEDAVSTGEAAAQAVPVATAAAESAPGAWHWFASLLPWPAVLVAVWAIGAAWGLLTLLRMLLGTRRLLRRAIVVDDSRWDALVTEVAGRLGVRGPVEVVETDCVAVPSTAGWLRPKIILPTEHRQWSAELRRVVLAHELTHVARRDVLWQMVARSAAAFYWFHPLVWLAGRRLRWEREVACDDAVLRMGEKPSSYASHLLGFAAALAGRSQYLSAAVAMATRRPIERRIRSVLQPGVSRAPMSVRAGLVLVVTTSLVLILVGLIRPLTWPEPALGETAEVETETADTALKQDKDRDVSNGDVKRTSPFGVVLPSGVTVEVLGVSEHPSEGKAWWKPDGTTLDERPYDRFPGSVHPDAGQISREVAVCVHNPNKEMFEWYAGPQGGGSPTSAGTNPIKTLGDGGVVQGRAMEIDDKTSTLTVRIEYGNGPWRLEMVTTRGSAALGGVDNRGIILAPASEEDGSSRLIVSHNVNDQFRMVAVDVEGHVHYTTDLGGASAGPHLQQLVGTFQGLPLSRVKEFRIETRPKRWVEFRNVSLHSGKQTKVKVITSEGEVLKVESDAGKSNVSDLETAHESVRTPDSSSRAASPEVPAGEPLVADFEGGPRLELVGLAEADNRAAGWWAPDGTPKESLSMFNEVRLEGKSNVGATPKEAEWAIPEGLRDGSRSMVAAVRLVPTNTRLGGGLLDGGQLLGIKGRVTPTESEGYLLAIFDAPRGRRHGNFQFSLTSEPEGPHPGNHMVEYRNVAMVPNVKTTPKIYAMTAPERVDPTQIDRPEEEAARRAAEQSPFGAVLPNGAACNLLGVARYTDEGLVWWAPDGSPAGPIPGIVEADVESFGTAVVLRLIGWRNFSASTTIAGEEQRVPTSRVWSDKLFLARLRPDGTSPEGNLVLRVNSSQFERIATIPLTADDAGKEKTFEEGPIGKLTNLQRVSPEAFRVELIHGKDSRGEHVWALDNVGEVVDNVAASHSTTGSVLTFPLALEQLAALVVARSPRAKVTYSGISLEPVHRSRVKIETADMPEMRFEPWHVRSVREAVTYEQESNARKDLWAEKAKRTGPFTVILPSGATFELLGVSDYPPKGKQWWKPDGSPLNKTPFDLEDYRPGYSPRGEPREVRQIAVRIQNPNGKGTSWSIPQSGGRPVFLIRAQDGRNGLQVGGLEITKSQPSLTVRVDCDPGSKRWVEFRNVSLHSGKQTEVKVITSDGVVLKVDADPSESTVSDLEAAHASAQIPDSPSPSAASDSTAAKNEKSLEELTDDQLVRIAPAMADGLTKAAALAYETGTLATADQIACLQTARDLRHASARLGSDAKAERAALKTYVEQTEVFRRRVQALHDSGARGGEDCTLLLAKFHHAVAVADLARVEEARADEMSARVEAVKLADELWTAARTDYLAGVMELTALIDILRGRRDAKLSLGMIAREDYAQEAWKGANEESARELEELRNRVEALREPGSKGGEDVNYYAVLAQQSGAIRAIAATEAPLARRAVELARKRLDATWIAYETGTSTVFALCSCFDALDAVQAWLENVRELEAVGVAKPSEDEKTDTIEQRLQVWRRIKALSDQGAKGGEAVNRRYAECQYVLARLRQYEATRQQEAKAEVNGVRTDRR